MISVEYLVFNNKRDFECKDKDSFEYFIQSNPNIRIRGNKIKFKNKKEFDYIVTTKNISNTDEISFHIVISTSERDEVSIEDFIELQRDLKKLFSVFNTSPQTLLDGLSQHFASQAYPLIFELENLMRKLITKFMLINVGTDWSDIKTPDDVKESIRETNKEQTYLHNVDFIKLKDFLFSEKFNSSKDELVKRIKELSKTSDDESVNKKAILELKDFLPISNWEKFFSNEIEMSKEKLSSKWEQLYILRNKVAHNKSFTKADLDKAKELIQELKPVIEKAIENLNKIEVPENLRESLEINIISNLNPEYAEFIELLQIAESLIKQIFMKVFRNKDDAKQAPYTSMLRVLHQEDIISIDIYRNLKEFNLMKIKINQFDESWSLPERFLEESIITLKKLINRLENQKVISNFLIYRPDAERFPTVRSNTPIRFVKKAKDYEPNNKSN